MFYSEDHPPSNVAKLSEMERQRESISRERPTLQATKSAPILIHGSGGASGKTENGARPLLRMTLIVEKHRKSFNATDDDEADEHDSGKYDEEEASKMYLSVPVPRDWFSQRRDAELSWQNLADASSVLRHIRSTATAEGERNLGLWRCEDIEDNGPCQCCDPAELYKSLSTKDWIASGAIFQVVLHGNRVNDQLARTAFVERANQQQGVFPYERRARNEDRHQEELRARRALSMI